MYNFKARVTKCAFCQYFVGNECTAAKSNGRVNEYYYRQAIYEYNQWLNKQKAKNTKYKYF